MPLELQIISTIFGVLGGVGVLSVILYFRFKTKELEMGGGDPELGPAVDALRDDLADMQEHTRAQLADMQERLDFAERLLTAGRASQDEKDK